MYKLTYFKATNIAGFVSGLQKKTFELDLREFKDKEIIAILGDNATGKSTFMSFIHPLHTPTNKKKKFVMEGKEGSILREYTSDDGTIIATKCIYSPSGTKHTSKLYFKVIYPNGDEQELNPNGNVASYYDLVNAHFGIGADFINFASYNNTVKGIVSMTDSERKSNVAPLMPNTKRFEVAFNIVNEKYKEYRSIIRNISQKIVRLRDEDTLRGELRRLEKDINGLTSERETLIKKSASWDGRIKALAVGKDIDELTDEYQHLSNDLKELNKMLGKLGEPIYTDKGMLSKRVKDFSERYEATSKELSLYKERLDASRAKLYDLEKKEEELSVLISTMATNDVASLKTIRKEYDARLGDMRYDPANKKYKELSHDTAMFIIGQLDEISTAFDALYESHGDNIRKYYEDYQLKSTNLAMSTIEADIHVVSSEGKILSDKLSATLIEIGALDQFANLGTTLAKRPANCSIDTCPFITEALKWTEISKKRDIFVADRDSLQQRLIINRKEYDDLVAMHDAVGDIARVEGGLFRMMDTSKGYLAIDLAQLHASVKNSSVSFSSHITALKELASILSEKVLYDEIVKIKLPEINRQIDLIEMNDVTSKYLRNSYDEVKDGITKTSKQVTKFELKVEMLTLANRTFLENLNSCGEALTQYETRAELEEERSKIMKRYDSLVEVVSTIMELKDRQRAIKKDISAIDRDVSDLMTRRDKFKYELNSLTELKAEKELVELNFNITHIMKNIIQPGKGLWKEILDIYMYDIKNIANQLLLNTFDGNLYLEDFIILDDSFIIPYVYRGTIGADISLASDSQQSTISTAMSLAILSKLIDKYGILTYDEVDKDLSPTNKEIFINILAKQTKYVGVNQNFIITHSPEYYEPYDVGYVLFPGYTLKNMKNKDTIEV